MAFNIERGKKDKRLGFGVPYFNTFFLKGTIMKYKCILFSPWLLKNPGEVVFGPSLPPVKRNLYPVVWIEWRSVRWGLQVHNYREPQKVGTWV